jgi:hypothetical protein
LLTKSFAPWRIAQILSVSWFFDVTTITGMFCVSGFLDRERTASKPFMPGMTTSISIRSGCSALAFCRASSPLVALSVV